jgi:hypothetical protein
MRAGRRGIGEFPYFEAGFMRAAYAAASARLRRPSFARMFPTWCSTVLRLMNSRSEIAERGDAQPKAWNVAVTVWSEFVFTLHEPVPEHPPPTHPTKTDEDSGVAVDDCRVRGEPGRGALT